MDSLNIVTWQWGIKYGDEYVKRLRSGLARHVKQPFQFLVERPAADDPLTKIPGCLTRLKMFDPEWQRERTLPGRIVCIDLDVVITGQLDPLFDRPESFVIWQGANAANPCPYNGSLFMFRTGEHAEVWQQFTFDKVNALPWYAFPDDQTWFAHMLPNAAGWQCGADSGVWSFRKRGWPKNDDLPVGARLVCFPGSNDPGKVRELPWIKHYWQ